MYSRQKEKGFETLVGLGAYITFLSTSRLAPSRPPLASVERSGRRFTCCASLGDVFRLATLTKRGRVGASLEVSPSSGSKSLASVQH